VGDTFLAPSSAEFPLRKNYGEGGLIEKWLRRVNNLFSLAGHIKEEALFTLGN